MKMVSRCMVVAVTALMDCAMDASILTLDSEYERTAPVTPEANRLGL